MSRKTRNFDKTRAELVEAAVYLFGRHGYDAVSIEQICRRVDLSRGGFYHHFSDKRDCFEAAWREVQRTWQQRMEELIQSGAWASADKWEAVARMLSDVFEHFADPSVRQINAVDAPVALGWHRWRELEHEFWQSQNAELLRVLDRRHDPALVRIVFDALIDSAMYLAHDDSGEEERRTAVDALVTLIRGLPRLGASSGAEASG